MRLNDAQERFLEKYLGDFVEENVISRKAREIYYRYSGNKQLGGKWIVATAPRIRDIINAIESRAMEEMSESETLKFEQLGRLRDNKRCWRGYAPVRGKRPYSKGSCRKMRRNPVPPRKVAAVACRGLAKRKKYRRGGTSVGVARARDLCNRRNLSKQTLARMRSYFARHRGAKAANAKRKSDPTSAAAIADDLWGGTAGMKWANLLSH